MNKKVHVATSRAEQIGRRCIDYAKVHIPDGWEWAENPWDCDVFISVLYACLLTRKFIRSRRCYNFHPGILPHYRGSGAYSWALLNHERVTGVTLHEIDTNIDTGPIIMIGEVAITETDTAGTLFANSMDMLYDMFKRRFHDLLLNNYTTIPNDGGETYFKTDLEQAKDITNIVKAFTFPDKESAYWVDSYGSKHYLEWK